jgi:hypothetical protein
MPQSLAIDATPGGTERISSATLRGREPFLAQKQAAKCTCFRLLGCVRDLEPHRQPCFTRQGNNGVQAEILRPAAQQAIEARLCDVEPSRGLEYIQNESSMIAGYEQSRLRVADRLRSTPVHLRRCSETTRRLASMSWSNIRMRRAGANAESPIIGPKGILTTFSPSTKRHTSFYDRAGVL